MVMLIIHQKVCVYVSVCYIFAIHLQHTFLPQVCSISAETEVSYYLKAWATPEGLAANPSQICPHRKP